MISHITTGAETVGWREAAICKGSRTEEVVARRQQWAAGDTAAVDKQDRRDKCSAPFATMQPSLARTTSVMSICHWLWDRYQTAIANQFSLCVNSAF